jgi:glycosyltransferase involved in cell wall biosynthesis
MQSSDIKRVLMMVNWKVFRDRDDLSGKMPAADLYYGPQDYWFFRHWEGVHVDVLDYSRIPLIHWAERNIVRNNIIQTLRALPRAEDYDTIISHSGQSAFLFSLLRYYFMKRPSALHILIDIGNLNGGRANKHEISIIRKALQTIGGVIYHARFQREFYVKYCPEIVHRTFYVPLGVDPSFFAPQVVQERDYILAVGQDFISRDWKTLVNAFSKLRQKVALKIVGVKDLSSSGQNIEILPKVAIDILNDMIRKSRFVVLPLNLLNYSYAQTTLLQCMSLGKAVLVTNTPAIADYVVDGETAMTVRLKDPEDLCRKMEFILGSPDERMRIASNARRSVIEKFNEKSMAGKIFNILKSIKEVTT